MKHREAWNRYKANHSLVGPRTFSAAHGPGTAARVPNVCKRRWGKRYAIARGAYVDGRLMPDGKPYRAIWEMPKDDWLRTRPVWHWDGSL